MSVFSTLSSLGIQKTCHRKAQLKAQASKSPWRWSQRPSAKWHLAKQPDHQVLLLRCWSPLGKLVQWRCVISLRTSSRRDAFQLTCRKASLSICTRAKGKLWIEATTGAWSWLSKWWRCWKVVEGLIRQRVEIDEMQCGFISGRGTTDAIFIVRQLQEKHLAANKPLYMAFVDLEKAFDRVPRDVIWWACAN